MEWHIILKMKILLSCDNDNKDIMMLSNDNALYNNYTEIIFE